LKHILIGLIVLVTGACAQTANSTSGSVFVSPEAPAFQPLGEALALGNDQSATDPGMIVDAAGAPVIVWLEGASLVAWRWNGSEWAQMGSEPLNTHPDAQASQPAITASPDGKVAVAWRECCNPDGNLYVAEWNGSAWQTLGTELDAYADDLDQPNPAIVSTPNGLVVAWRERDVEHNTHQLLVRRWDGLNWQKLGDAETLNEDPTHAAQQITLTTLPTGNPVVMWSEWDGERAASVQGRVWDGANQEWAKLPPPESQLDESLGALSLDITEDDVAFVALDTQEGPLIETMAVSDTEWQKIGFPVELKEEQYSCVAAPTLLADEPSSIVMVWADTCQSSVSLSDWNGTAWSTPQIIVSANSQYDADDYTVAAGADGKVYVAWLEDVNGVSQVRVASYGMG
jgi:hypothetical protein